MNNNSNGNTGPQKWQGDKKTRAILSQLLRVISTDLPLRPIGSQPHTGKSVGEYRGRAIVLNRTASNEFYLYSFGEKNLFGIVTMQIDDNRQSGLTRVPVVGPGLGDKVYDWLKAFGKPENKRSARNYCSKGYRFGSWGVV